MKRLLLTGLALTVAASVFASEENRPYIGLQGQQVTWEEGSVATGFRADVDAVAAVAGVGVNQVFGVEGRYAGGVDGETIGGVDVDLDRIYGFYVRATLPTDTFFSPYAVAGYSNAKLEFDGESARDSEDGGSWGGGITFSLEGPLTLDAEWIQYVDQDQLDIDGFNLGLTYRF